MRDPALLHLPVDGRREPGCVCVSDRRRELGERGGDS